MSSEIAHQISSQQTAMAFLYLENETEDYQALLQMSDDAELDVLKFDVGEPLLTTTASFSRTGGHSHSPLLSLVAIASCIGASDRGKDLDGRGTLRRLFRLSAFFPCL